MTSHTDLTERLAPSAKVDEVVDMAIRALRNEGLSMLAGSLNEWLVDNNARKSEAAQAIEELRDRADGFAEALHQIVQWSDAYPLDIFPEPDFAKAHELLKAGGMTLDAISASNMRHVVKGVGDIARRATEPSNGGTA